MGNSQSNARTAGGRNEQDSTSSQPQVQEQISSQHSTASPVGDSTFGPSRSIFSTSRHRILSDSWRRQSQRISLDHEGPFDPLDDRSYEPEDRPLFHSNHDPPVEPHSERPPNWRHSTMSRLGSRLLPDSVARGLTTSGEETAEEGQALRNGLSSRSRPSVYHRRIASTSNERFSMTSSFRRRTIDARGDPSRTSVRRLFTSNSISQSVPLSDDDRAEVARNPEPDFEDSGSIEVPRRSRTRLARVRNSLSVPFTSLFGSDRHTSSRRLRSPPLRPSRTRLTEESDELLSQPRQSEGRPEADDNAPHELDATEPEARNLLSSSRITSGMSTIRRFPGTLRSRSTRLIRRGEHPPLSQVLQLAAAAIAAQLSGSSINSSDGPNLGPEAFDGSIQNFVQTLQEAASAQAGQNIDLNATDGELPPVNFMRVFQFPNDENGTPMPAQSNPPTTNDNHDGQAGDPLDRSVTLVLVGVRSMPNFNNGRPNENGTLGPSLDTLLSLPFLPPANVLRNGSSGALFRRSDTRVRPQSRRHSMTNFNFPQQYESQRHSRTRTSGTTRTSVENGLLTPLSESPPGPHPPPSTPADIRSGHATPIRRPSSASAVHTTGLPDLEEIQDIDGTALPAEAAFNTARQRRRSDSEFARRPELSSGNARRNGVVEPDRPSEGVGRSWLIYVVGTNVSPDHPAFTMPSLFTDNPSYEDMQMLSTLLGPVKPPVASQDDVEAAGGLYRLSMHDGILLAEPMNDTAADVVSINVGDRCLICLCEYEENDQVRQINTCRHVYHRECVDEVSKQSLHMNMLDRLTFDSGSRLAEIVVLCAGDRASRRQAHRLRTRIRDRNKANRHRNTFAASSRS